VTGQLRAHVPLGHTRWSAAIGVGYSFGNWSKEDSSFGESPYAAFRWDRVSYADIELGIARRWRSVELRFYVGHSFVASAHGYHCDDLRGTGECNSGTVYPDSPTFFGIAVGYALPL
jgi:hypothetical protein